MSLDIWLEFPTCPTCGLRQPDTENLNHTYNCSPMWREAGWQYKKWENKCAGDMAPVIKSAIQKMIAERLTFEAMNPPNGWGDYQSCLRFLGKLYGQCAKHPNATVKMWR